MVGVILYQRIRSAFFTILMLCTASPALAFSGTEHAADMLAVLLGEGRTDAEVRVTLREFTKTIDNFNVIEGVPVGKAGHRVYGHWGFAADIPFEHGELKETLDRIAVAEGEKARTAAIEKIRAAWHDDARHLIKISERLIGIDGKAARGLAGLLYDVHLLGDWQGKKLGSLQDADAIFADLQKCVHRLFGNNSKAARDLVPYLRNSIEAAQNMCGHAPDCTTLHVMNALKKATSFRGYLANLLQYRTATSGLLFNPVTTIVDHPQSLAAYETAAKQRGLKVATVQPGLLLADGRLLVAMKTGASAGVLVFAIDGATACYNYLSGNITKPELRWELGKAAINGAAVSGCTAVAVILGASPGGLVVLGIGAGTYLVVDTVVQRWHQEHDKKYLSINDLKMLGLETDSPLDIKIDESIPLNVENWN